MDKPISMQVNEARDSIIKIINELNLHPIILEPIIKEIYEQVRIATVQMAEKEKAEYEANLEKEKEKETK